MTTPLERLKAELKSARNAALEEAANGVRAACGMCCDGYANMGNSPDECEYCGRPMAAIRALKEDTK